LLDGIDIRPEISRHGTPVETPDFRVITP
jgi:hypothetical protein